MINTQFTHTTGLEAVSVSKMKQYKPIALTTTACKFEPILVEKNTMEWRKLR